MNKVILCGRLARDPEVRYSAGAEPMAIAKFTLAVDRKGKKNSDGPNADFIGCAAFDKRGEFVEKYCKQGTKLILEGHIQTGSYTNKAGVKVYTTEVIADGLEFAESKGEGKKEEEKKEEEKQENGFMNIPDEIGEELPFG